MNRPHLVFPRNIFVVGVFSPRCRQALVKRFVTSGRTADPTRDTGGSCSILSTITIESNRPLLSLYRQKQWNKRQITLDTKGLCGTWTEKSVCRKWNTLRLQLAQYSRERSAFLWGRTLFATCESVGETDVDKSSTCKDQRVGGGKNIHLVRWMKFPKLMWVDSVFSTHYKYMSIWSFINSLNH